MKKKCAIGETGLYLRKTDNLSEETEGMGEREKRGIEKRQKELS